MKINIKKDSNSNFHIFSQKTGKSFVVDKEQFFFDKGWLRLLDVSITNFCRRECDFCYKGSSYNGEHMALSDYRKIIREAVDCGVQQIAIGGGEPTTHPNFIEILECTRDSGIIPNYSTNGDSISDEIITATSQYCGAVAISVYGPIEKYRLVVEQFTDKNCRVNLHFVMRNSNLEYLTTLIKKPPKWFDKLNALVFLNYKPVRRGLFDDSVKQTIGLSAFFDEIKKYKICGVAFDTCSVSYINKFLEVEPELYDFCEAARTSAYISENLQVYPCSFYVGNGNDLRQKSLRAICANSNEFIEHRRKLQSKLECSCKYKEICAGGCPIYPINYCDDCIAEYITGGAMTNNRITATAEAREHLAKADPIMGAVIEKHGVIDYPLAADYLVALLSNIIGQQLSGKVADVIWKRFEGLIEGEITASKVLALDTETMRSIGTSYNKAAYIKNIAQAVANGSLMLDKFTQMSDEAVIGQLTAIKGIGAWTAEMFLVFSLGRLDVFSKGDGGLARAINNLYGNGTEMTAKERSVVTEAWKPYRSIASLYLWRSLDNK